MERKDRQNRGMSRRGFLGLTGAALGTGVLAACAPPAAPAEVAAPATAAAPAEPAMAMHSGPVIIALRDTTDDGHQKAGQDALVAAYNAHQPDVDVVFEAPPGGITGGYHAWLTTQLAADDIRLDVVSGVDAGTFRDYLNLDRYVSAHNPYAGKPWNEAFNFERFKWANAKGERYGLAAAGAEVFWYANMTMLDEVGAKLPDTWTEFIDACEKLTAVVDSPIVINFTWQGHQWVSGVYFDQYHLDWVETVRAHEGDWNYDPEFDGNFVFDPGDKDIHSKYTFNGQRYFRAIREGELRFDTDAFAEMIDNLSMAWPQYATEDFFVRSDGGYATWLQQQAAFLPSGTWALPTVERDLKEITPERLEELGLDESTKVETFEWAVFPFPTMEGPLVQCRAKDVAGQGDAYVSIVKKNQEQIDRCLDFLMFWYSESGMQTYYDARLDEGWPGMGPVDVYGVTYPPERQMLNDMVRPMGNAELNQNNWEYFSGYESWDNTHVVNVKNAYKEALERKTTGAEFAQFYQQYWMDNFDDILALKDVSHADLDNPAREPGT